MCVCVEAYAGYSAQDYSTPRSLRMLRASRMAVRVCGQWAAAAALSDCCRIVVGCRCRVGQVRIMWHAYQVANAERETATA